MGKLLGNPSEDESISLESLSETIKTYRAECEKRFAEMQKKIDGLKSRLDLSNEKVDKRISKITNLLDDTMDDFQQVITIFSNLTMRVADCEKYGQLTSESIAKNKSHLNDLSKYLKQMSKTWEQAQIEIDKLKDSDLENTKFRWKITAGFTLAALAIMWILKNLSNADNMLDFFISLWPFK